MILLKPIWLIWLLEQLIEEDVGLNGSTINYASSNFNCLNNNMVSMWIGVNII